MKVFKAITIAQAQQAADALRHAAKLLGVTPPSHAQAQSLIAKENGYASWADLKAAQAARVDAMLAPHELKHAQDAGVLNYRGETHYINVDRGFSLRFGCSDDGNLEHARVLDPVGREILYYVDSEFVEAPLEVTRALLTCLSRSAAVSTDDAEDSSKGEALGCIPLSAVGRFSCVIVDGQYFRVNSSDNSPNSPDETVLWLESDDDDQITELYMAQEELEALKWDPSITAFVSPEGTQYVFHVSKEFTPADF